MNSQNQWFRNGFVYLLIILVLVALAFNIFQQPRTTKTVSIAQLAQDIKDGQVSKTVISGSQVTVTYTNQSTATTSFSRNTRASFEETRTPYGVTSEQLIKANVTYENGQ